MMVSLRRWSRNGIYHYYLEHSLRQGQKVVKKAKYIGPDLPGDLNELKDGFLHEIYREQWFNDFDRIRDSYQGIRFRIPASSLEKETMQFGTRFTFNTNRMEGSTLTLRETVNLLEHGLTPASRSTWEMKETESHKEAYDEIIIYKKDLSLETVLYFHRKLFLQTKKDIAGRMRDHQVAISGSRFLPPMPVEVYPLMRELMEWYSDIGDTVHPVELAGLVQLRILTIHPFADGNGRIARLMMNLILHQKGFPMLDIPYTKRGGYYNALERSQVEGDDHPFLRWFFKRYKAENRRYL